MSLFWNIYHYYLLLNRKRIEIPFIGASPSWVDQMIVTKIHPCSFLRNTFVTDFINQYSFGFHFHLCEFITRDHIRRQWPALIFCIIKINEINETLNLWVNRLNWKPNAAKNRIWIRLFFRTLKLSRDRIQECSWMVHQIDITVPCSTWIFCVVRTANKNFMKRLNKHTTNFVSCSL